MVAPRKVSLEAITLPYSPATRPAGIEAELVNVGCGVPEDFARVGRRLKGKIAMVTSESPAYYHRWVHRAEKYARAVKAGAVDASRILMDAKTGVSGAGIRPNPAFHYPERYDNANAYKVLAHQHQVEVERELGRLSGGEVRAVLVTQVVPMCRGILTTIYAALDAGWVDEGKVHDLYRDFYRGCAFIRLMPPGGTSATANVRGSNFCDISIHVDERTGTLVAVSHIDNLVKGQAGSALQNMNVMMGLEETMGLMYPGHRP